MKIKLNWNVSIKKEFCKWAQKSDLYDNDLDGNQPKELAHMNKFHVNVILKNILQILCLMLDLYKQLQDERTELLFEGKLACTKWLNIITYMLNELLY